MMLSVYNVIDMVAKVTTVVTWSVKLVFKVD